MLPHLDGMSATAQIRQFDRCTPIVSLTANFTQDARIVYMSYGMNDVLPKPFSKDTLLNVVEKYCVHLIRSQDVNQAQMTLSISHPLPPAGTIEKLNDNVTLSDKVLINPTSSNAVATISLLSPALSNRNALSHTSGDSSSNNGNNDSIMATTTAYNNSLSAMMLGMTQHMVNWSESNGMTSDANGNNTNNTNPMNTGVKRAFIELATEANPNMLISNGLTSNSTLIYNLNQVKRART
jgi:CheY-like chemotaxis protein